MKTTKGRPHRPHQDDGDDSNTDFAENTIDAGGLEETNKVSETEMDEQSRAPTAAPDAMPSDLFEKEKRLISINAITIDPQLQMRASEHDEDYITELSEAFRKKPLQNGVIIFQDPQGIMWLADGHARVEAHRRLGAAEIPASVRLGDFRDAWRFALKANSRHGARRTKADIRRCVETALSDNEMHSWTSGKIARACAVSPRTVQIIRKEHRGANDTQVPEVREGSDGKMYRTKKGAAEPHGAATEDGPRPNAGADHADDPTKATRGPGPVKPRTPKAIDQDLSWIEKHSSLLRERMDRVLNDVRVGAKPTRDITPLRALREELNEAIRVFEASGTV